MDYYIWAIALSLYLVAMGTYIVVWWILLYRNVCRRHWGYVALLLFVPVVGTLWVAAHERQDRSQWVSYLREDGQPATKGDRLA